MTRNRRWVCDCGNNVLAPGKMRRNDVRRFCFPCSERAGVLVERTCPALDRERAARADARREKAKRKRDAERAKTSHITRAGKVARIIARLDTWAREGVTMDPGWMKIRNGSRTRGRAGYFGRVWLNPEDTRVWHDAIILHEFVHICLYRSGKADAGHGQAFRGVYLAAASEFFGIPEAVILDAWRDQMAVHGRSTIKAYHMDHAVVRVVTEARRQEAAGGNTNPTGGTRNV